jgi:hypothetical protein
MCMYGYLVSSNRTFILYSYFLFHLKHTCLVFRTACTFGTFGDDCRERCNITCKGCDTITGICDSGCHPGWKGSYCGEGNQKMLSSFFNSICTRYNFISKGIISSHLFTLILRRIVSDGIYKPVATCCVTCMEIYI